MTLEIQSNVVRQEKETGGLNIEKEKMELSLFAKDRIIKLENSWESMEQHKGNTEVCFSKVVGYSINVKKKNQPFYTQTNYNYNKKRSHW